MSLNGRNAQWTLQPNRPLLVRWIVSSWLTPCSDATVLYRHPESSLSARSSSPVLGPSGAGLDVTVSCQRWPGFTPWLLLPPAPLRHTAARGTTGHQAGASPCGLQQGSWLDQYLCISCPFAQVSSLIITAWRSLNALAGWAKGRDYVTFPRPWVDLERVRRNGDGHNKET